MEKKLMDIQQVVEGVYMAIEEEDYETLSSLRDLSRKVYSDLSPKMRNSYQRYLSKLLWHWQLDEKEDLNCFFSTIVGSDIPVYEGVGPDQRGV